MNLSNDASAALSPPCLRWFAWKLFEITPACCSAEIGNPRQTMEPTFEKLLVILAEGGVGFVIVGGVAVTLHGYVRLTEDVDILLESSPANIQRFLDSLADYGEGFARELSQEDFTDEEGAIRIVEETNSARSTSSPACQVSAISTSEPTLQFSPFKAIKSHMPQKPR